MYYLKMFERVERKKQNTYRLCSKEPAVQIMSPIFEKNSSLKTFFSFSPLNSWPIISILRPEFCDSAYSAKLKRRLLKDQEKIEILCSKL